MKNLKTMRKAELEAEVIRLTERNEKLTQAISVYLKWRRIQTLEALSIPRYED